MPGLSEWVAPHLSTDLGFGTPTWRWNGWNSGTWRRHVLSIGSFWMPVWLGFFTVLIIPFCWVHDPAIYLEGLNMLVPFGHQIFRDFQSSSARSTNNSVAWYDGQHEIGENWLNIDWKWENRRIMNGIPKQLVYIYINNTYIHTIYIIIQKINWWFAQDFLAWLSSATIPVICWDLEDSIGWEHMKAVYLRFVMVLRFHHSAVIP
jgi:hypothetical protein